MMSKRVVLAGGIPFRWRSSRQSQTNLHRICCQHPDLCEGLHPFARQSRASPDRCQAAFVRKPRTECCSQRIASLPPVRRWRPARQAYHVGSEFDAAVAKPASSVSKSDPKSGGADFFDTRVTMREFFARLGLVALSVVVAVGAVEIVLRLTYDVDDLYAAFQLKPEIADVGWQRAFVWDYGRVRGSDALVNDLAGYVHDPELGWDVPKRFRTGPPASIEKPNGVFRVLAIGDSYAYGAQVQPDQSYAAYLERLLPSSQVLNMGVRAYGIDQAVLKYLRHGRAYRADLIVFGVFGPDYTRTPPSFFRFAKPVFRLGADGELVLTHTPVPTPEEMYRRLTAELPPLSYLGTLARVAYQTRFASDEQEAYYNKWDPLIERLFVELLRRRQRGRLARAVSLHPDRRTIGKPGSGGQPLL